MLEESRRGIIKLEEKRVIEGYQDVARGFGIPSSTIQEKARYLENP